MRKSMREIYNCGGNSYFNAPYNYNPMLETFGEVLVQVDDNDYQGDTRVLYKDENGRYGHLMFGWGSCSGCDSLQACESYEDIENLAESLYNSIKWFDSKEECLEWFNKHDWKGDYSWYYQETRDYVEKAKEFLSKN